MKKVEWYPLLPPNLLQAAHKSGNEQAWTKEDALRVIDVLNAKGLVITAVEPFVATESGVMPLIFDWHISYSNHPSSKFPDTAAEFIEQFDTLDPTDENLRKGKTVLFNLSAKPKNS